MKREEKLLAFTEVTRERDDKKFWVRIGVAHVHNDGIDIDLDAVPVSGKVRLRSPDWAALEAEAGGIEKGRASGPRTDAQNMPRWKGDTYYRLLIDISSPDEGPGMRKGELVVGGLRDRTGLTVRSVTPYSDRKNTMGFSIARVGLTEVESLDLGAMDYEAWFAFANGDDAGRRTASDALRFSGIWVGTFGPWTPEERAQYLVKHYKEPK